jgi:hypothetical protein
VGRRQRRWIDGDFFNEQTINVPQLTATQIGEAPTSGINSGPVSIARQSKTTTSRYFQGQLYEVIVIRQAIADADREAVTAYLKTKWGI